MRKIKINLKTEKNGPEMTVRLSGELNTLTAPEFDTLLARELPGVQNLTLDFAECDYVSSAGIRILLKTFQNMKRVRGKMILCHVGENFMDVLVNTGLDTMFDIL